MEPLVWFWVLSTRIHAFDQLNDPESNAFLIAGSAGGDNISAERHRKSAFFELGLPFTEQFK